MVEYSRFVGPRSVRCGMEDGRNLIRATIKRSHEHLSGHIRRPHETEICSFGNVLPWMFSNFLQWSFSFCLQLLCAKSLGNPLKSLVVISAMNLVHGKRWDVVEGGTLGLLMSQARLTYAEALAHRNRRDFCDLRLRCPPRTPEITSDFRDKTKQCCIAI